MPFAGYENFGECEADQRKRGLSSDAASKVCGKLQAQTEGKAQTDSIENKSFTFHTDGIGFEVVIDSKGKKGYFVTGHISTPDVDLVNDLVTEEALDDMLHQITTRDKPFKIDVEHETIDTENGIIRNIIPVGKIISAKRDAKGLWVRAKLNPALDRFHELWGSLETGFLDAFSITFRVADRTFRMINGIKTRILHRLNLINIALTGVPINAQAQIMDVFAKAVKHDAQVSKKLEEKTMAEIDKKDEKAVHADEEKKKAAEKAAAAEKAHRDEEEEEEEEKKKSETKAALAEIKSQLEDLKKDNVELREELKALQNEPVLKSPAPEVKAAEESAKAQISVSPLRNL